MLRRVVAVLIGALAALALVAMPSHAFPGATADGVEGESGADGALPIDIVRVTHADTPSTITYTLQSSTDFSNDVLNAHWVEWNITLNGGNTAIVDAGADGPAFSCNGDAPAGTVTVTRESSGASGSTAANTVKVSFPRSLLTDCGLTTDSYLYYADVSHPTDDTGSDAVPDDGDITHQLGGDAATTTTAAGPTTTAAAGGAGAARGGSLPSTGAESGAWLLVGVLALGGAFSLRRVRA